MHLESLIERGLNSGGKVKDCYLKCFKPFYKNLEGGKGSMKKFLKVLFLGLVVCSFILGSIPVAFSQLAPELPRSETLIVDILSGRIATPDNFNVWAATWRSPDRGIQQLMLEPLWMDEYSRGKIINALASDKPIYNKDFTRMTVKLRKGMYWSDGVEFTADDVVYTVQLIMKHSDLGYYAQFSEYVNKVYSVGKYIVVFELKKPNSRFHTYFLDRWGACRPLPKHVFEKAKDPVTFAFNPPISSGPYTMKSYDPGGYWCLWERRADWDKTPTGKLYGMPQPKYVLFNYYPTVEKRTMALITHQLDMGDFTIESLRSAMAASSYVRSYYREFPWAEVLHPCVTGLVFNTAKFPYNNKDVRWALALAIDIVDFVALAEDGAGALAVLHLPFTRPFQKWYYDPMESWLKNFSINVDGKSFKVYDPNASLRLAEYAKSRGYKVPTDSKEIRETFGYGWFKYAPDVAEKLLIKNGFKKDENGKWLLPDGKPWKITILATSTNPAHPSFRNASAASQEWKKFGIDVEVVTSAMSGTLTSRGDFEVSTDWPATEPWGGHPDLYRTFNSWRSIYIKPIGEQTFGHTSRWSDPRMDKVIEQMEKISWDDPKTHQLGIEGLKIVFEEMPGIPITGYPSFVGWDEYYWTNYPGAENAYCQPHYHWPNFKYMLPFLKPTGRK